MPRFLLLLLPAVLGACLFQLLNFEEGEEEYEIDPDKLEYHLFTRQNVNESVLIYPNDVEGLRNTPFNPKFKTKILIHGGFMRFRTSNLAIRLNLLSLDDLNVIEVNWMHYSWNYWRVQAKSKGVGRQVAKFIDYLAKSHGVRLADVHCIGYCLGAHPCGFAGKFVSGGKIGRISGIEPALPGFNASSPEHRLDAKDAQFVDCIHTTGWDWPKMAIIEPICSADFYPNGGVTDQPGCFFSMGSCGHTRGYDLFVESILKDHLFPSQTCDSLNFTSSNCRDEGQLMGYPANEKQTGIFYLKTTGIYPYATNWTFND